jgi:carbon storage regulator CsrA
MLVLSRKPHQQIVIPSLNIRITVIQVAANRVQLGIDAPTGIRITRSELAQGLDDKWAGCAMTDEQIRPI